MLARLATGTYANATNVAIALLAGVADSTVLRIRENKEVKLQSNFRSIKRNPRNQPRAAPSYLRYHEEEGCRRPVLRQRLRQTNPRRG